MMLYHGVDELITDFSDDDDDELLFDKVTSALAAL